ncbi:FAD-dependent oxidoreductase [Sphingobium baderi]|uniref:Fumarate reductase n=1 Tax=Sphingobium baderi TaxID=1332080 RepID=A0A0S3EZB2_9SPHN|nr:FAD-dependent oxidoreductase [Sphingobium baderi]ALR20767.1 fumarate reductase [Sphingobium baderi]
MPERTWDEECDVLIVGSGAGGLTAAVAAADLHARVILIEKGRNFGGTSATSGAVLWVPDSHLAEAAGQQDDPVDAVRYIKAIAGDESDDILIRAFVENGREMLSYMSHHSDVEYVSIPYPDYQPEAPGARSGWRSHDVVPMDGRKLGKDLEYLEPPHPSNMLFGRFVWNTIDASMLVTRKPGWIGAMARTLWRYYSDIGQRLRSKRSRYLTGGNALIGRLKLSIDRRGINIRRETALVEIIRDGAQVVGAVVERHGRKSAIHVHKGLVLAAGGFERNAALRARYLPQSPNPDWSGSQSNNQGDALELAMSVGAATDRLDSAWWAPAVHVRGESRSRPLFFERALPGSIIVNQAGDRYFNEAVDYHLAGRAMVENDRPGAGTSPSYILFDAGFKWRYPMGPVLPMMPLWMHSRAVRDLVFVADDWGEMADRIGVDRDRLQATITRFNDNARQGRDSDFQRGESLYNRIYGDPKITGNPNLLPLVKAPFYALAIYPGDIGTNGGLVTDGNANVLDTEGRPIGNLYATGNITASAMGRSYPGGGATIGPAMTFGYLAARHAMGVNEPR